MRERWSENQTGLVFVEEKEGDGAALHGDQPFLLAGGVVHVEYFPCAAPSECGKCRWVGNVYPPFSEK